MPKLMPYRPYPTPQSLGYMAAKAAGRAALSYGKSYIARKLSFSSQSSKSGAKIAENGVTFQKDRVLQYRKKKMPRRKKRGYLKKVRMVNGVINKSLGTRSIVFNESKTVSWATNDQQQYMVFLYGYKGTADANAYMGEQDVARILINDTDADTQYEKAVFSTGVLDMTLHVPATAPGLEIDVYTIYFGKGNETSASPVTDILAAQSQPKVNGAIANYTINTRGVTPFQLPLLARKGWKIFKKVKHIIGSGQVITIQNRDSRNRTFAYDDAESNYRKNGVTMAQWFIIKPIAGVSAETTKTLHFGVTRTYAYKCIGSGNVTKSNLLA